MRKIDSDVGAVAKASMGVIRRLEKENRELRKALAQLIAASDDDGSPLSALNLKNAQNAARAALSR